MTLPEGAAMSRRRLGCTVLGPGLVLLLAACGPAASPVMPARLPSACGAATSPAVRRLCERLPAQAALVLESTTPVRGAPSALSQASSAPGRGLALPHAQIELPPQGEEPIRFHVGGAVI